MTSTPNALKLPGQAQAEIRAANQAHQGPLILALASILLAGCSGHSIDCSMGVGHGDCAAGTPGHEVMVQERQADKSIAAIDEAKCRPYPNFCTMASFCLLSFEETEVRLGIGASDVEFGSYPISVDADGVPAEIWQRNWRRAQPDS